MKYFIIFLFLSNYLFSQNDKVVYGNFVADNKVYQYKCEKDNSIYKFSISSLEPKTNFEGFSVLQVDSILDNFKSDTSRTVVEKKIIKENLIPYFENIKIILTKKDGWDKDKISIDSTILKIKNLKLKPSNSLELLEAYKSFLEKFDKNNESTEKITQSLALTSFRTNFKNSFLEINKSRVKFDTSNFIADEVFYAIKAKMEFKDDEPITAYLILKKKYIDIEFPPIETLKNNGSKNDASLGKTKSVRCKIENVKVEFDEGTIKNIFIDVIPQLAEYNAIYGVNTIRYRNNKPISISTKFDPDNFNEHRIFVSNENEILNILYKNSKVNISKMKPSYILLSNILDLKIVAENDKEDYSPANCVVELSESSAVVELKKEKRSKLFTAIGYSDLAGLSQNNQNGLVQLEISRRCNINTWMLQGFFGKKTKRGRSYTGYLNYIKPVVSLNKIETNNKYLFLNKNNIDTTASFSDSSNHFRINQLDIYRYRTFNIQGNLNIFNWNLPNKKIAIHLDYSFNYGNTIVTDSFKIKNHSITNIGSQNLERIGSFIHGPDLFLVYKPENRFGLTVGSTVSMLNILSENYRANDNYKNAILKIYALGFFKTNDESKLFFRFAFNQTMTARGNNFYQLQLGYLIDLFTASK